MKKTFVPIKYILFMVGFFEVLPTLAIFLIIQFFGIQRVTVSIIFFCASLILILGPVSLVKNRVNNSVVFEDNAVTNFMNDGTDNFWWTEEIDNIRSAELVDQAVVRQYYKNCRAKKAILLNFGQGKIRYITVDSFTNRQINQVLHRLKSRTGDGLREP